MGIMDWIRGIAGGKTEKSYKEYQQDNVAGDTAPADEIVKYGLNFQQVIEAHQNWKNRLQNCIDGTSEEKLDPDTVCRDDKCMLGMWIYADGKEYFGHNPLYAEMKDIHAQFHVVAGDVVKKKLGGDMEGAKAMLNGGSYHKLSVRLQGLIAKLYFIE